MRELVTDTCPESTALLKHSVRALDTSSGMRTQELKLRVRHADYVIDPAAVAEAMLRHAVCHRRWWNPRTCCATPSEHSTASGGPAKTSPIQRSGAANSASDRSAAPMQMHSS